jgi:hypothetical protein
MKTRIVYTKIWQDDWFSSLSRCSKILFLYLITNQDICMTGYYELSDRVIIFHTGLNQAELEVAKKDLKDKVRFYQGWVNVINSERYNSFRGEKNNTAVEREIRGIPKDIKTALDEAKDDRVSIPNVYSSDTSIISNHNNNINNKPSNKGSTYSSLESLTPDIIKDVSDFYHVPSSAVQKLKEQMELYCESNGKTYKNYKSALMQWTLRRIEEGKIKTLQVHSSPIKEMLKKAGRNDIDFCNN